MRIEARPVEVIETTEQCFPDLGRCNLLELAAILLWVLTTISD